MPKGMERKVPVYQRLLMTEESPGRMEIPVER